MRVEIRDESGAVVEAGEAIKDYTHWWKYAVQQPMCGEYTVTVFARDLPRHVTQESVSKRLSG